MMARRKASAPPGFDGKREPIESSVEITVPHGDKGWKKVLHPVVVNVRESSLETMSARGQIDKAQKLAGEWFRRNYEKCRMGSMAIDPSYEPVDISGHADPIPDRVIIASQAIAKARKHVIDLVGLTGWLTIELICGQGYSVPDVANRRYGFATRAQKEFTSGLLRASLDELAGHLGYASKRKSG